MRVEQISVFLENKAGRLSEVTGILTEAASTSGPCRLLTPPISASCG